MVGISFIMETNSVYSCPIMSIRCIDLISKIALPVSSEDFSAESGWSQGLFPATSFGLDVILDRRETHASKEMHETLLF